MRRNADKFLSIYQYFQEQPVALTASIRMTQFLSNFVDIVLFCNLNRLIQMLCKF